MIINSQGQFLPPPPITQFHKNPCPPLLLLGTFPKNCFISLPNLKINIQWEDRQSGIGNFFKPLWEFPEPPLWYTRSNLTKPKMAKITNICTMPVFLPLINWHRYIFAHQNSKANHSGALFSKMLFSRDSFRILEILDKFRWISYCTILKNSLRFLYIYRLDSVATQSRHTQM